MVPGIGIFGLFAMQKENDCLKAESICAAAGNSKLEHRQQKNPHKLLLGFAEETQKNKK